MARRGARTVIRYVKSKTRRRGSKNGSTKRLAKKAAYGTLAGMAVSVPLTLGAKYLNMPQLMEVGQRGGAIVASALGGTPGQVGYQVADAVMDRFVFSGPGGNGISGTSGQVYL